jgi:hypothetical protein
MVVYHLTFFSHVNLEASLYSHVNLEASLYSHVNLEASLYDDVRVCFLSTHTHIFTFAKFCWSYAVVRN